jgi:Uma2 family endonuclease
MQFNLSQLEIPAGNQLILKNVDWKSFEQLLEELGDNRGTRLSFSDNTVEIMTPMSAHENDKRIIGRIVETILEEMGVEYASLGSTTFKNEQMTQAVEPDECFYIQNEEKTRGKAKIDLEQDPPPDLAIEIDLTSRTHFNNYEKLGVPELWRFDGKSLNINILENGMYIQSKTSRQFPNIPLQEAIPRFITESKTYGRSKMIKSFKLWLKDYL